MNPNNCAACQWWKMKRIVDTDWCYWWHTEPLCYCLYDKDEKK